MDKKDLPSPAADKSYQVDALNARPRVWSAVAKLLGEHFPELREPYQRILFDRKTREAYLAELRGRIAVAAAESRLGKRVRACW